jgi:hypothetical protein
MDDGPRIVVRPRGEAPSEPREDVAPDVRVRHTTEERLLPVVQLAFAPLHKAAFGVATGTAGALLIMALTIVALLSERAATFPLHLFGQYFRGYDESWRGVLIGGLWGFATAFVAGWFIAFCRNLALAISAFSLRTRAELSETREFLDHI